MVLFLWETKEGSERQYWTSCNQVIRARMRRDNRNEGWHKERHFLVPVAEGVLMEVGERDGGWSLLNKRRKSLEKTPRKQMREKSGQMLSCGHWVQMIPPPKHRQFPALLQRLARWPPYFAVFLADWISARSGSLKCVAPSAQFTVLRFPCNFLTLKIHPPGVTPDSDHCHSDIC